MTSSDFCLWKFLSKNAKGYFCRFSYHQISGKIKNFPRRMLLKSYFLTFMAKFGYMFLWMVISGATSEN
jgi:hypothetical protein